MFFLSFLTDLITYGFGLTTPLLAGLHLAWPRGRPALRRQLAVSARLLLAAASVLLTQACFAGLQAYHSPDDMDLFAWQNHVFGPYRLGYWGQVVGQGLLPQLLWWPALCRRLVVLVLVAIGTFAGLGGLWLLRYAPPQPDYLPSAWEMSSPLKPTLLAVVGIYLLLLFATDYLAGRFRPNTPAQP
jgi:hypothetical protein